jgi:hypothetical protein
MAVRGGWRAAAVASAVAALVVTRARDSYAQLHQSIERIADAWRGVGAAVVVDKTRFLNEDETIAVVLPEAPDGECTTVVLLGARGLGFHARTAEAREDDASQRIPSEAGALSLELCGAPFPRRLLVTSDSGRGAIETVVGRSAKPLPPLRTVLLERTGGSLSPATEPGLLPPLPAPEKRAQVAEGRAKRDGAAIATRMTWQAGVDGAGAGEETLQPGCHTLALFALDPGASRPSRRGKLDLDAEMRDAAGDRLLARDRTDAPDAHLAVCVGETTRVGVVFVGSPPSAPVLVAHFAWPLPDHLPAAWGTETRARMAHVLLARHVMSPPRDPVVVAQGGSGTTSVPVPIEPGACYLAVVSLVQGVARTVGLRVRVGARQSADERGVDDSGAAAAFCAGERARALAEVEARGSPLLGWGLALYRLQAGVWEVPR